MIIRELVNRISFKVNPGDKANAEKAMSDIEEKGSGLINFTKGVGTAISTLLKGYAGLQIAGTKLFTELEQNESASKFFARTQKESENLRKELENLKDSEIISDREIAQAEKSLSRLNISANELKNILPVLKDVTTARIDLDFNQVVSSLKEVVEGGDLQSLMDLVPGIKKDLELLSKTTFAAPFGKILQEQRIELVSKFLLGQKDRIKELADEARKSQTFQFKALGKEASDFTLNFGKETAGPITEIIKAVKDMLKELNESETFWKTVKGSADSIRDSIKETRALFSEVREKGEGSFIQGLFGKLGKFATDLPKELKESDERTVGQPPISIAPKTDEEYGNIGNKFIDSFNTMFDRLGEFPGFIFGKIKEAKKQDDIEFDNKINSMLDFKSDSNKGFENQSFLPGSKGSENSLKIELTGGFKIEGENTENLDLQKLNDQISGNIIAEIKTTFQNITARNGGLVGSGQFIKSFV